MSLPKRVQSPREFSLGGSMVRALGADVVEGRLARTGQRSRAKAAYANANELAPGFVRTPRYTLIVEGDRLRRIVFPPKGEA